MSFSGGFEKTAFVAKAIGTLAGAAERAGSKAIKSVQQFAVGQRNQRVTGYRGALGKTEAQKAARTAAIGKLEASKVPEMAKGSLAGTAKAQGGLTTMEQKQQAIAKARGQAQQNTQARLQKVEQRAAAQDPAKKFKKLDTQKGIKAKNSQSIFSKHPFMTAGATLLGAKALMGGGQQQAPPPPPQVVQY